MAVCKSNKIDSNVTGLRFAEEECLGLLPSSPAWYPLEPNSYSDFGGQITTVARNPINQSRQRKKGVTTDLEASGGFNQDFTFSNTTRLLQGFLFADMRGKGGNEYFGRSYVTIGMDAAQGIGVQGTAATYFAVGQLVRLSGFSSAKNNGLKVIIGVSGAYASVEGEVEAATASTTHVAKVVGHRFGKGVLAFSVNTDGRLSLSSASAELPRHIQNSLLPGEWVYFGSDNPACRMEKNNGFARVHSVNSRFIYFDKYTWTPDKNETATEKFLEIYFADTIRNELDYSLIKRRSYQLERTLGSDQDGQMSEYLVGAIPNEATINIAQADKINIDLSFVATDNEQRTGKQGIKSGDRPELNPETAFNTSSDFARIRLAEVNNGIAAPKPMFAYATELSISINNNVTPTKAVGVLGAIDASIGTFEVGGNITAYFADVDAMKAVRNNADVTLDVVMIKEGKAVVIDIPLMALGNGRLSVEQDQAITIPLEIQAAQSSFGHTLMWQFFSDLPKAATTK